MSSALQLEESIKDADLTIGAVLIPGALAPKLITREMLRTDEGGSVFVDVAIDQGGCAETSKPTTHDEPVYTVDGVIHYCVANMPGAVPITSTRAHERHAPVRGAARVGGARLEGAASGTSPFPRRLRRRTARGSRYSHFRPSRYSRCRPRRTRSPERDLRAGAGGPEDGSWTWWSTSSRSSRRSSSPCRPKIRTRARSSDAAALLIFFVWFLGPIYAWLMVGAFGQTLGKMAVGVRVVRRTDASRVSYGRAFGRAASTWLLGVFVFPILLAYLWPLWDRRNQTLYDKMAGTIVVVT